MWASRCEFYALTNNGYQDRIPQPRGFAIKVHILTLLDESSNDPELGF